MNLDDMILISIDDHIIEPPDLFERHMVAKYRDRAPKLVSNPDGPDQWIFEGEATGTAGEARAVVRIGIDVHLAVPNPVGIVVVVPVAKRRIEFPAPTLVGFDCIFCFPSLVQSQFILAVFHTVPLPAFPRQPD